LSVYEELSRADGSAGWTVLANATSSAMAGAYTGENAAKEMFGGGMIPIHAGHFAPRGTAIEAEGGYRISGQYSFGSGSAHASWIGGGALPQRDGELVLDATGMPLVLAYFVPRDRVEFLGNWDVMGLAGTGSYDYAVPEQLVDEEFTFPLVTTDPRRGGPLYHLGVLGLIAVGHTGFALGVAQRAIEELTRLAQTKHRLGADPIIRQPLFQHDFALIDAALRSARAYAVEVFGVAEDAVRSGRLASPEEHQRLRQVATYATRVAADTVRFCYEWAGSDALRNPSVLQRCFRDLHAATQHMFVEPNSLSAAGRVLLGIE
jgi:alkylation response protein AidB-like acyl-CoA dehydrogenase